MTTIAAIMNASTVLAREVLAVLEDLEVEPFSEIRLFGTTADTFLRYRDRDIRIATKSAERYAPVRVAILGGPGDVREGVTVVAPVPDAAPAGRGGRGEAPIVDPALDAASAITAGLIHVPRAGASIIARLARALGARRVTATVLEPAGELGPAALTELYEQTMALFAHKPLPEAVFGDRLAFNVLPGRSSLAGVERLAGCPVAVTSLLLPLFAGTQVVLDLDVHGRAEDVEDTLEDAGFAVQDDVQPATIVGVSDIHVRILSTEPGRVRLIAVADEARLTASSLVALARRVVAVAPGAPE